jgi:hypothetical protein
MCGPSSGNFQRWHWGACYYFLLYMFEALSDPCYVKSYLSHWLYVILWWLAGASSCTSEVQLSSQCRKFHVHNQKFLAHLCQASIKFDITNVHTDEANSFRSLSEWKFILVLMLFQRYFWNRIIILSFTIVSALPFIDHVWGWEKRYWKLRLFTLMV